MIGHKVSIKLAIRSFWNNSFKLHFIVSLIPSFETLENDRFFALDYVTINMCQESATECSPLQIISAQATIRLMKLSEPNYCTWAKTLLYLQLNF